MYAKHPCCQSIISPDTRVVCDLNRYPCSLCDLADTRVVCDLKRYPCSLCDLADTRVVSEAEGSDSLSILRKDDDADDDNENSDIYYTRIKI